MWAVLGCVCIANAILTYPFHQAADFPSGWTQATTPLWTSTSATFSLTTDPNCCCIAPSNRTSSPGCLTSETPCSERGNITVPRIFRSPLFVLQAGNITFNLYGGVGTNSTNFADPLNPPSDWIGIAVRNASSGEYVAFATHTNMTDHTPEPRMISEDDLAPYVGELLTLDFINTNTRQGNWSWASISDVTIPGHLVPCGRIADGGTSSNRFSSSCSCDDTASGQTCALSCNAPGFEGTVVRTCNAGSWDNATGPNCVAVSHQTTVYPFNNLSNWPSGWSVASTPNWTFTTTNFSITTDANCCMSTGCLAVESCESAPHILRSPPFILGSGDINFALYGMPGTDSSTAFSDPKNPPADWVGVALRDLAGTYAAAMPKRCINGSSPEFGVIVKSKLTAFVGSALTFDFINTGEGWSAISDIVIPSSTPPPCGPIPHDIERSYSSSCSCGNVSFGQTCTLTCNAPGFRGSVTRTCLTGGWDSMLEPSCTAFSFPNTTWGFHKPGDFPSGWAVAQSPKESPFSITYDINCCGEPSQPYSPGCLTTETPCSARGAINGTRIFRSPEFTLLSGSIFLRIYGQPGADSSTTFADPMRPPAQWVGLAVRNASGYYIAAATKGCSSSALGEPAVISEAVLAPFVNSTVTLDLIHMGGNGWASISDLIVPGFPPIISFAISAHANLLLLSTILFFVL